MNLSPLSLLAVALLAVGCASLPPADDAGPVGTWRLVALGGEAPAVPASLTFTSDGRVSGSTGCNRLTGTYRLAPDGALTFGPLATTRRACAPAAMTQERRVLDVLDAATHADVADGRLVLSRGGHRLVVLEASPAASASGEVTGTVTYFPRVALPPDAVVTVRLLDVSRADAPSTTLAQQTIPADGRRVPFAFALDYDAGAIEPRRRYAVRAEIRSASGDLLWTTDTARPVLTNGAPSSGVEVRVVQAASGALVGPAWRLVEIREPRGVALSFDGEAPFTISFGADGRLGGRAGCNRYGGSVEAGADGSLALSEVLSTLAACPGPSVSGDFFDVLGGVERYALDGDRLTLSGQSGALVFESEAGLGGMPPQETGRDVVYACASTDGPFTFRTRTGPGELAVWLPARFEGREGGTYRVLGQVRAASGAKYQDGPVTVWTKGTDYALLEVDGESFPRCTPAP